jgi:hypothetical protein
MCNQMGLQFPLPLALKKLGFAAGSYQIAETQKTSINFKIFFVKKKNKHNFCSDMVI